VSPNSIKGFELPKRESVETAAQRVYDLLTAPNKQVKGETYQQRLARLAAAEPAFRAEASALSHVLLGPVADILGTKRLVIVSEGALQYIPFAALPTPTNDSSAGTYKSTKQPGGDRGSPLILDHEIVNLPSMDVLAALRRELSGRRSASKTVAVIADPVYAYDDPRIDHEHTQAKASTPSTQLSARVVTRDMDRSADEAGVGGFRRLRFSREEADAITSLVPSTAKLKAVDFVASRETATSDALSDFRILHLATHGLLNSRHPELSGLVLSLFDEQGTPRDGFLRVHEIYNLRLNADLVVLSACQTALGKEIRGEGLIGLTRGFMYAGAARVVASLWSVEDRATAELMKRFYRGMLSKGMRPAAALREAQISLLSEKGWEAPYYWAAFTLQGEWR
jgi:CHAT domain-containing protein